MKRLTKIYALRLVALLLGIFSVIGYGETNHFLWLVPISIGYGYWFMWYDAK